MADTKMKESVDDIINERRRLKKMIKRQKRELHVLRSAVDHIINYTRSPFDDDGDDAYYDMKDYAIIAKRISNNIQNEGERNVLQSKTSC